MSEIKNRNNVYPNSWGEGEGGGQKLDQCFFTPKTYRRDGFVRKTE